MSEPDDSIDEDDDDQELDEGSDPDSRRTASWDDPPPSSDDPILDGAIYIAEQARDARALRELYSEREGRDVGWIHLPRLDTRKHRLRRRRLLRADARRLLQRGRQEALRRGFKAVDFREDWITHAAEVLGVGPQDEVVLYAVGGRHHDDGSACLHCDGHGEGDPTDNRNCGHTLF